MHQRILPEILLFRGVLLVKRYESEANTVPQKKKHIFV